MKEDIEDFIEAGINFWMITGDKMDTAETIGYSCGIISEDSEVYKIKDSKQVEAVIEEMEKIKEKIKKSDNELVQITERHNEKLEKIRALKRLNGSVQLNQHLKLNTSNELNKTNNKKAKIIKESKATKNNNNEKIAQNKIEKKEEYYQKISGIIEISPNKIIATSVDNYIQRLDFENIFKEIQEDTNEFCYLYF